MAQILHDLASARHLLNTNSLALKSDLCWRKLKPSLPHRLLSVSSVLGLYAFHIEKHFAVYVLIAFYVFLFKVQTCEAGILNILFTSLFPELRRLSGKE